MRLRSVEHGQRLRHRLMLGLFRVIAGADAPLDVARALLYRPEYFGREFANFVHAALRGPSEWSVGERELFAAFTSKLNECRFCVGSHSATASAALGHPLTQAVLADWRAAPVDAKVRATLGFLEKMTLTPEALGPGDVDVLRSTRVSDQAMVDAIYICMLFNIINRIADALGFHVSSPEMFAKAAKIILKHGYSM